MYGRYAGTFDNKKPVGASRTPTGLLREERLASCDEPVLDVFNAPPNAGRSSA